VKPPLQSKPVNAAAVGVALFCLVFAWGGSWPIMKMVVAELPIYTFRMITAWGGGVCMLLVALLSEHRLMLHRKDIGPTILCGFLTITAWLYFTALALTLLPAGRAVVLAYTMPLWSALAGTWLLHEPLTRQRIVCLAFGLIGVLILVGDDIGRLGTAPYGVVAILAAAASWGLGTVMQKRTVWHSSIFTVAAWQLLFGGIPFAGLAFFFESDPFATFTLSGALGMAYVVVVATVFGYWLWFRSIQLVPAGIASLSILPVPFIGLSLSTLFLGETLGWPDLAALICMTIALTVIIPKEQLSRR
tara:strand:+ start:471 stop:1379 length:909 start_codon:yes stop_codon:yes gene_type:complete